MKINQVSLTSNNPAKHAAILTYVLTKFKALQFFEFSQEPFIFPSYPVTEDINDASSAREINGALNSAVYAPSSGGGSQKAYGYEIEIDKAYLNDLKIGAATSAGLIKQIEGEQLRLARKVLGDVITDIFNGTGANKQILGLNNFCKDVDSADQQAAYLGLTQAQVHSCLQRVDLTLDLNDRGLLLEFDQILREAVADMGGSPTLVMNARMFAVMGSVAKALGAYTQGTNDFGKPVDMYDSIPMASVANSYMPFNEADGVENKATSLHLVNFNEADGVRYATNSGLDFTDFENLETKPSGKSRLEFIGNFKIEDPTNYKRLARIRAA